MDPINPWLDPSEVRHLAEKLIRPVEQAEMKSSDPGFDASFVGFTDAQSSTQENTGETDNAHASTTPTSIAAEHEEDAMEKSAVTEDTEDQEEEATPTAIAATSKQFEAPERIQIFRDWLAEYFDASEIFILDQNGEVIFDESGHGRLHFIARNLIATSNDSSNIHVKIGPSSILELVTCDTPNGRIILGAIFKKSLFSEQVANIVGVLEQTASPV